jgi:signal peptidase I
MPARKFKMKKVRPATAWTSVVALSLMLGMTGFVSHSVRLVKVPSKSMQPTFEPGDVVTVRIDAFRHHAPSRGDIVVFHSKDNGELLIKRVVGLPGEAITVWSGHVIINGKKLEEPYLMGHFVLELPITVTLGQDEYWVMGDHRDLSDDSRDFGPIKQESIVGRATAIIWPMKRRGHLPEVAPPLGPPL